MRADRNLSGSNLQAHVSTRRRVTGLTAAAPAIPAVVQHGSVSNQALPPPVTLASPVTSGNLIVCGVITNVGDTLTVTDNQGNTYTQVATATTPGVTTVRQAWTKASATGTLTVSISSSSQNGGMTVYEVSNVASATPVDQSGTTGNGSAAPVQGPNLTGLATSNDFVAYWSCYNPPGNAASGGIWTDNFEVLIAGAHYTCFSWAVTGPNVTAPVQDPGTNSAFATSAVAYHP